MVRILTMSEKKFIENQRDLGIGCQEISKELRVKIRLVYKWTGLINQGQISFPQGRPVKGVGSSFEQELLKRIAAYRVLHPKWGAKTIRVELIEKDKYNSEGLPSEKTIERYVGYQ